MRQAKPEDPLVQMTCPCGSVIVHEPAADAWRCERGHSGTRGKRWEIAEQVLTLDDYVPSLLRPAP